MRHVRNAGLAVAVALCIVVPLIVAIDAAQPSSNGAAGPLPAARQSLVQEDLKEVNYYPAADGHTYMWSRFDPTVIDRDFARIRALGANTVRIFIQPKSSGSRSSVRSWRIAFPT